MASGILVLVEHQDGRAKKSALELLSKATELGIGPVSAAVIGAAGTDLTAALAQYGATKVYYVTGEAFAAYLTAPHARALEAIVKAADPVAVLAAASAGVGKDLLPRVAARFGTGVAADCTGLSAANGRLSGRRPVFAGKAITDVEIPSGIQFFSVRPNSFTASPKNASASAVQVSVSLTASDARVQLVNVVKGASEKVDLTEADRIVSGGRSLGSAENFKVIQEVADVIGATVGASRAAVDAGYASHDMQVGQTGKTVNPTLYIAYGISGAIQHLAGMRSSKVIVAINKDADAPIFQVADYGIVGDLFQAAPLMAAEFRKLQG